MLHSLNMMPSFTCPLPVQRGGGRRSGSLADAPQDCSTSEAFLPRTVLTDNISRCVQHILQHFPTTMAFLTASTITFSWMASTTPQADSWCLGHVEPDDVVIADIGGPDLSPRSRVCAQEWHCKDIHSHNHSHTPMHIIFKKNFFFFFLTSVACRPMTSFVLGFFLKISLPCFLLFFIFSLVVIHRSSSLVRFWVCVGGVGRGVPGWLPIRTCEMRHGVESIHNHTQLQ